MQTWIKLLSTALQRGQLLSRRKNQFIRAGYQLRKQFHHLERHAHAISWVERCIQCWRCIMSGRTTNRTPVAVSNHPSAIVHQRAINVGTCPTRGDKFGDDAHHALKSWCGAISAFYLCRLAEHGHLRSRHANTACADGQRTFQKKLARTNLRKNHCLRLSPEPATAYTRAQPIHT